MTRLIGINFHGIGTPRRPLEKDEAPYWLSQERFKHVLDQIATAPDPSGYAITFDDGNLSDRDIGLPALAARGLRARFFVLTGRLGTTGSLDAPDVKALMEAGMTIGSHGIGHAVWPALEDAALGQELRDSRARLEDLCGCAVREAGIPFGRYDARVLRALRASCYTAAWSSDGGSLRQGTFLRARTSLRGDMPDEMIASILAGRLPPLRQLRRAVGMARRRWTVTG